ncbi:hypothetical protein J7I80_14640 [Bacillus sp. ISL-41]|uniref:hypothetical protein n=1 Tax=unclassified Bacillus (in: firmicutes) TaxID=185979 RepID=UPI001BECA31C|nr:MULTISPECIES: hypothetical protein [unclassified Bacillus (in: firmicutes)]MBT2640064.1 hypothetical protein [Bacillus sp. ISL-39]MBT2643477.1 hypothetical protein [Bacillus sp. ISL-41]
MLSFRAVFKNNNEKFNTEWNEVDLTWYDDPSDDPFDFEYVDEEDNTTYVAWTEHLIRFHNWVFEYYSKGYSLLLLRINIYRDHDQTQDDILFSMSHFPEDYNTCVKLIKEALGNYSEASKEDLKFIHYLEQSLPLFNRIIHFNRNISNFLAINDCSPNETTQYNSVITTIFELPYLLYQVNTGERDKIINNNINLLKEYIKHFSVNNSNDTKRAKDSTLLLINELTNTISISDDPFCN